MKVIVFVKATKDSEAGVMPSTELLAAMGKYNEELVNAGIMVGGEGLHPSSRGKRVAFDGDRRTVIDGPFAETKELVAGFWIWQVKDMAEAVEWLKRCPNPHCEPSEVEIRPIFTADDFGAEFTPELREQEAAIRAKSIGLGEVRFEQFAAVRVAGLNRHYTPQTRHNIPAQWKEFAPTMDKIPGRSGQLSYGVCWNNKDCDFDYVTGVELAAGKPVPPGYTEVEVPAGRYAIFMHQGLISQFPQTLEKIWTQWAPEAGLKIGHGPCVERYAADFCDDKPGGVEVLVPLE
jgi:predicted transcriptional regulator YdeE